MISDPTNVSVRMTRDDAGGNVMSKQSKSLWALVALVANGSAYAADSFHDLQVAYRCEVVRRLERIYTTGDPASQRNRFIAITMSNNRGNYVQCMFHDNNSGVYCEAASGYWQTKEGAVRTAYQPPATIRAFAQLGFDTDDAKGNFNVDRDVGKPADFNAIADFILRALHDGYGARADMRLQFRAPFAPFTPTSCIPVG